MGKKKGDGEVKLALDKPAHSLPFDEVLKLLTTDPESGLSKSEVEKRTSTYGENMLEEGPGVQPMKILVHQVANALTLVSPLDAYGHRESARRGS
jgi:magnesium-transporting ATPase (P-type)